jgi:hypothetical protein
MLIDIQGRSDDPFYPDVCKTAAVHLKVAIESKVKPGRTSSIG